MPPGQSYDYISIRDLSLNYVIYWPMKISYYPIIKIQIYKPKICFDPLLLNNQNVTKQQKSRYAM